MKNLDIYRISKTILAVLVATLVALTALYMLSYECKQIDSDIIVCESRYDFLNEIVQSAENLF